MTGRSMGTRTGNDREAEGGGSGHERTRLAGSVTGMATTLVCRVVSRQPVAIVALYGTLDQTSAPRALVALRDCLAEAPGMLLVDVAHLVVASPAALAPVVSMIHDAHSWPGARIGFCGGSAATAAMFADFA